MNAIRTFLVGLVVASCLMFATASSSAQTTADRVYYRVGSPAPVYYHSTTYYRPVYRPAYYPVYHYDRYPIYRYPRLRGAVRVGPVNVWWR